MKNFIKTLLGAGITIGLSNREEFVKHVSGLINDYQKDPQKADKWAQAVVAYLEQTKDNINMESALRTAVADGNSDEKKHIEELTEAIKTLTRELQQAKDKK